MKVAINGQSQIFFSTDIRRSSAQLHKELLLNCPHSTDATAVVECDCVDTHTPVVRLPSTGEDLQPCMATITDQKLIITDYVTDKVTHAPDKTRK